MSSSAPAIGTQIDRELVTLHDLLAELQHDQQIAMLRTTARHIANFLSTPIERITIEALIDIIPEFRTYLNGRRYKRNAVSSYCNYAGVLLRKARELGWSSSKLGIPAEWEPAAGALSNVSGAARIIRFAVSRGKTPATLSNDDLENLGQVMLSQGRCYVYVRQLVARFRLGLFKAGLSESLPGIFRHWRLATPYFVPVRAFPAELRQETTELLRWRQAKYVSTRRKKRLRAISARSLECTITRLYGFLVNVRPQLEQSQTSFDLSSVRTLGDLVTSDNVGAFTDWWINVRNLKAHSLVVRWATLYAALKEAPNYRRIDFSWFHDLIKAIPKESESSQRQRKERKFLPYEVISDIPRRIREQRTQAAKGSVQLAHLVHDELLIKWLVVTLWRQRNIRECRIGLNSEGANLFKAEIEEWDTIARPKWVEEKQRANPREKFWQYRFVEDETKNGNEVRSILPRRLIAPLEEYLEQHRPLLIEGADPGTLFVNQKGKPLTSDELGCLVSQLTLSHAGKRVTPHNFRHIFAYWWLRSHPEDYLTLSKKLWHRTLEITIRIYGCKFDESQADCRVEEWVEANEK